MIVVNELSKFYQTQYKQESALAFAVRFLKRKSPPPKQMALKNISFTIAPKEIVGVIGLNGSGKSTLLKILAGIYVPSSGSVEIKGKISYLSGFGHGLKERLSMHENIYLMGAMMEIPSRVIDNLYEEIVEFSGLKDFIHQQVFTFSSGMRSRLSFSITIHFLKHKRPDIIILDEVLNAGGDIDFNQKATAKMVEFIQQGSTVILASHNMEEVKKYCSKVIWIKNGSIRAIGEPKEIVEEYISGKTMAERHDIVALTSYFNPNRYKNRFHNYLLFSSNLARQNIPLITVECSSTDHFDTPDLQQKNNIVLKVKSPSVIWHKEHLLNVGIEYIKNKTHYKKIIFLDCDITFLNENWVQEASYLLDKKKVIQPFSMVVRKTKSKLPQDLMKLPEGRDEGFRIYSYFAGKECGKLDGDFGFAWGARVELFKDQGLYHGLILGGADNLIKHCWDTSPSDLPQKYATTYFTKELKDSIFNYHKKMFDLIQQNTGHVPGAIIHHYHGHTKYRDYTYRYKMISQHGYDPERDLKINTSGGLEFIGNAELSKKIKNYFYLRNEDNKFAFLKDPIKFLTPTASRMGLVGRWIKRRSPTTYRLLKPFFPDR